MKKLLFPLVAIFVLACTKEDAKISPAKKELNQTILGPNITYSSIGRVMFYDTRLSANNLISCASCHKQSLGFADNSKFSTGFQGHETKRNSLAISGLGSNFNNNLVPLFWDGRESDLNNMVLLPVLNHVEMGMSDKEAILERVKSTGYYDELFKQVIGEREISIRDISTALESFVLGIEGFGSKFDMVNAGNTSLTALEQTGKDLFFNVYQCGSCHQPSDPYSSNNLFFNIGLDVTSSDLGRAAVTGSSTDNGKFRVPSLKNVALSSPYMHDGRFNTLEDVIDHYSHGIQNNPNLDPALKSTSGGAIQFNITENQKKALVAFLNTFTDLSIVNSTAYSDPFNH